MISLSSIWAITLRHMRIWKRDLNSVLMLLYWPMLDIIMWGFLGSWIAQTSTVHNYETIALLGVLLWQVVGRSSNTLCITFNEELWSNNLVNVFSLPLRIVEWLCGALLYVTIVMIISAAISMLIMSTLYNVSMWHIFTAFIYFMPPLFISSIWLGLMSLQLIVTFGKRITELAFIISWFFMPFSGAFYPIEVLPEWGQKISALLPMSYVFEGMRGYVMHQQDPTSHLIKGYVLSIVYATSALFLFIYCFNRTKKYGLTRLMD